MVEVAGDLAEAGHRYWGNLWYMIYIPIDRVDIWVVRAECDKH